MKMDREVEISQRDKTMTSKVLFFFKQSIDKLTAQIKKKVKSNRARLIFV